MSVIQTPSAILDLAFSPHEPELLLASLATGELIAYHVGFGGYTIEEISRHMISPGAPLHTIAFSPVSRTVAAATAANGYAYLLKIPRTPFTDSAIKTTQAIQAHSAPCLRAAFSADGRRLYTAGEDGVLTSWSVTNPSNPKQRWSSTDAHDCGITALQCWPAPFACDVGKKRRLLMTGSYDGMLRIFDMSMQNRPPFLRQEMDLGGPVWRLAPLPPLPMLSEIDDIGAGMFTSEQHPDVELDPEQAGMIAASAKGGARVLIHKQKFEEVFLPRRDGSGIVDWTTSDGVKMDHEGREKMYWWYDLADIEEHGDSPVYACDAVAIIDYDPLFKDSGKQRLRRGWRLCSVSRDGTLCFWQVYVE